VNQRQLIQLLRNEPPIYAKNDNALFGVLSGFDTAYTAYNDFQRQMERYWVLRWLIQEKIQHVEGQLIRENLVRLSGIPLVGRFPSIPELPANTVVTLEVGDIDLLDLSLDARFVSAATPATVETVEVAQ